jgi:putative restriction endonuclease
VANATDSLDLRIRLAMFTYLERLVARSPDGTVRSSEINRFKFEGQPMRLIVQTGIWKPAVLEAALTIRTTYTPPNQEPPYSDSIGTDGLIRYKYHGLDPNHSDNRALRAALTSEAEMAYFVEVDRGVYVPRWPVWIVAEDTPNHEFAVAVDHGLHLSHMTLDPAQRAYVVRLVQERLHQPVFRSRVLRAYESTCAMCRLRHGELLDAAHILPDGHPWVILWFRTGSPFARSTTPPSIRTSLVFGLICSSRCSRRFSQRSMVRCCATVSRRCRE